MSEDQYNLLYKKLTKEISQSENVEFDNWLSESVKNELLFRRMKDVWDYHQFIPRIKGQGATFERISKLAGFEEGVDHRQQYQKSSKFWQIWHGVAAVIVVFVTIAAILYFNTNTIDQPEQFIQSNTIIKTNPAGQKTRINLPDGSVCWLNSESEVQYLPNFSDSSRNIHLIGEAYFEVAKDPSRPFKVHAPSMTITALGTIFNVTSFPGEINETVALIEGKIAVKCQDGTSREVLPGEAVQFDRSSRHSSKMDINANDFVAWKNGELIFDELNYEVIFIKLERWYGVNISVTGHMPENRKYKARFNNQTLINVLESMKYGHEWEYKLDGKNVEIMFN